MPFSHTRTLVRLWFMDREGTESFCLLHFPVSLDYESQAIDGATLIYAPAIATMSDCQLSGVDIEFSFFNDDPIPASLPTQQETGYRGSFFFETGADDRYVIDVPALKEDLYIAPDDIGIDTTQSDVSAFVAAILADGAADIVNPFNVKPVSLTSAFKRLIPIEDDRPSG